MVQQELIFGIHLGAGLGDGFLVYWKDQYTELILDFPLRLSFIVGKNNAFLHYWLHRFLSVPTLSPSNDCMSSKIDLFHRWRNFGFTRLRLNLNFKTLCLKLSPLIVAMVPAEITCYSALIWQSGRG